MYLSPIFDEEDLKIKKVPKNTGVLQVLQNSMIRIILDLKKKQHINMQKVREDIKTFSVNQMAVYHTLIEAYGVIRNSTSDQIKAKWLNKNEKYTLRSITNNALKIPDKPKCIGFTYTGSKLFNKLPSNIKETETPKLFKILTKNWIWKNIPSY